MLLENVDQRNVGIQREKDQHYTYNVTLGGVRASFVAVEKQYYYIFRVCVCSLRYPACNARAPYCRLWPVRLYNIFPHYLINGTILGGGGELFNIKCVFWLSMQLLSATFLILTRTERDVIKNKYIGLHVKHPIFLSDFNKTWIFSTDFRKIFKYQIQSKSAQWESSCSMRADRHSAHRVHLPRNKGRILPFEHSLISFLWPRWWLFTARYELVI
jgi:hypothetical protein